VDQEEQSKQLNEIARHYDTKLWAIPIAFFIAEGAAFNSLNLHCFFVLKNMLILAGNGVFSFLVWVQFEKDHFWEIVAQWKILVGDSENSKISFYTLIGKKEKKTIDTIKQKIIKWAEDDAGCVTLKTPSPLWSEFALCVPLAKIVSCIMRILILLSLTGFLIILIKFIF